MNDVKRNSHPLCFTIAGGTSGLLARFFGQPLDVLKIRFQLQNAVGSKLKYNGIINATATIIREEGTFALWKGLMPAQILSILYGIVQFNSYEYLKRYIRYNNPMYLKQTSFKAAADFVCGGVAGVAATFVCQPVDVIRTRLIMQEKVRIYRGMLHASTLMMKESGVRTFYKGMVPTLMMIYPYVGFHFAFYGLFKQIWLDFLTQDSNNNLSKTALLACGSLSGICSKLILLPFDMIKKRLQVVGFLENNARYDSMLDCVRKLVKQEGMFVLYRGASASVLKAGVVTGITFLTYEKMLELCYKSSNQM